MESRTSGATSQTGASEKKGQAVSAGTPGQFVTKTDLEAVRQEFLNALRTQNENGQPTAQRKTYAATTATATADLMAAVADVENKISLVSEALRNSCLDGADEELSEALFDPALFVVPSLAAVSSNDSDNEAHSADYYSSESYSSSEEDDEADLDQQHSRRQPVSPDKHQLRDLRRRVAARPPRQRSEPPPPKPDPPVLPAADAPLLPRRPLLSSLITTTSPQQAQVHQRRLALLTAAFPATMELLKAPERLPAAGAPPAVPNRDTSSAPVSPRADDAPQSNSNGQVSPPKRRAPVVKSSSFSTLPGVHPSRLAELYNERRKHMQPSHTYPAAGTLPPQNRVQFPPVGPNHATQSLSMERVDDSDTADDDPTPPTPAVRTQRSNADSIGAAR